MFEIKSEKYHVTCDLKGNIKSTCLETGKIETVLENYSAALDMPEHMRNAEAGLARVDRLQTYHCSFIDDHRLVVIPAEIRDTRLHWIPSVFIISLNNPVKVKVTMLPGINRALILEQHYLVTALSSDRAGGRIQLFDLRPKEKPKELFFDSVPEVTSSALLGGAALNRSASTCSHFAQLPNGYLVSFDKNKFIVWDVKKQSSVEEFDACLPEASKKMPTRRGFSAGEANVFGASAAGSASASGARGGGMGFGMPAAAKKMSPSLMGGGGWGSSRGLGNMLPQQAKRVRYWYHLSDWEVAVEFDGKLYCVDLQTEVSSIKGIECLEGHQPCPRDLVRSSFLSIDDIIDLGEGVFATIPPRKATGLPPSIHVWSIRQQKRLADLAGGIGFGSIDLKREGDTLTINNAPWSIREQRCLDRSTLCWQKTLLEAASQGDVVLVEACLARVGLDVNYRSSPQEPTALHLALLHSRVKIAKLLIDAHADTALTCETEREAVEKIQVIRWTTLLLTISLYRDDAFRCGPRPQGLKQGALDILLTLGDEGRLFLQNFDHLLPAVMEYNLPKVMASLEAGGQLEYPYITNGTLLHLVCAAQGVWCEKRLNMLSFLVSRGLSVTEQDPQGKIPLECMLAIRGSNGVGFTVSIAGAAQEGNAHERDDTPTFDDKRIEAIAILMGDKLAYQYQFVLALQGGDVSTAIRALRLSDVDVNEVMFKSIQSSAPYSILKWLVGSRLSRDVKLKMVRSLYSLGAKFDENAIAEQVGKKIPFEGSSLLALFSLKKAADYQLIVASGDADLPEMKRLLAVKADVNFNVDTGARMFGQPEAIVHNALLRATACNQAEAVQLLLAHGVSETKKNAHCIMRKNMHKHLLNSFLMIKGNTLKLNCSLLPEKVILLQ